MNIRDQIRDYRITAARYRNRAREATEQSQKDHWNKLAQVKLESAEIREEQLKAMLEEGEAV